VIEISKKDLLERTGISYGQLYRWKRERLIPEEWFVKRSAITGQETYFPEEQILDRIEAILDLKEEHSLEEIRTILTSEVEGKLYVVISHTDKPPRFDDDTTIVSVTPLADLIAKIQVGLFKECPECQTSDDSDKAKADE